MLYLSWFNHGGPTKFESIFLQIANLRFSTIFVDFHKDPQFSKDSQGMSLKARDSSPTYLIPLKTKFTKTILGGGIIPYLTQILTCEKFRALRTNDFIISIFFF